MAQLLYNDELNKIEKVSKLNSFDFTSKSPSYSHLSFDQRPVIKISNTLISYDISSPKKLNNNNKNNIDNSDMDRNYISGVLNALREQLSKRNHFEYYLCNDVSYFFRSSKDASFGCGYRNLQTLVSVFYQKSNNKLFNTSIYKKKLFNGNSYIPNIGSLQRYLDYKL